LANLLVDELKSMGVKDVKINENCYVYATIPSNIEDKKVPAIGFVAHVDTSPDTSGKDVKPQIIENYKGGILYCLLIILWLLKNQNALL
jgi:tripeptide aminopeptidase